MQWSFSNNGSALHKSLSFQGTQGEKPKTGFESLASTGLVTITTTRAFEPDHRIAQKRQNLIGSVSQQPLSGVPGTNSITVTPCSSSVVGTTDLRNCTKISEGPAQLTIFFNGSVCVFENILPEKAQAIMLLAGNGTPKTSSQSYGKTSYLSPVPIISVGVPQKNDAEPLKVVNSVGSFPATHLSTGNVPQFRKKSLARFLEKRKERVISTSPYAHKQSPDDSTPGAAGTSSSINSLGFCAVQPLIDVGFSYGALDTRCRTVRHCNLN